MYNRSNDPEFSQEYTAGLNLDGFKQWLMDLIIELAEEYELLHTDAIEQIQTQVHRFCSGDCLADDPVEENNQLGEIEGLIKQYFARAYAEHWLEIQANLMRLRNNEKFLKKINLPSVDN